MKLILLTISLFSFLTPSIAQHCVAGQFDANDYQYVFNPAFELTIIENNDSSIDTVNIDLNNDGMFDVQFILAHDDGGNWYDRNYVKVVPLNNNQVAAGPAQMCYANCTEDIFVSSIAITQSFDSLDIIDYTANWIDSNSFIYFSTWESNVPNPCGYACNGGLFNDSFSYVGVRVYTATETLYGWIKLKFKFASMGESKLTVSSFACDQLTVAGISEETMKSNQQVVRVIDLLGRETTEHSNQLLIYIYSDGSTQKVIRME